ncbi:OLC1v1023863C1 [Oldenlandia corymbosa var. corymbosa]|uniref:OLC1v1023863C1 n=1 Tax=Oldenlandia corymbosa var. corymbosa TaxID=529605 RepID=A0AAV1C154_OLDCO|nr:OLC1v1023863C1 [Oldenlandia corymbosa var. corymbosa]
MDAKALAKSKRAHSLHHSKKYQPNPTSRASTSSVTATSGKKATSKQEKDKSNRSHGSKDLPSNWDRYREEFDSGFEETPPVTNHNQACDAVAPKSKGADYAYLLNEAKTQSQTNATSNSLSLYDDVFTGFHQAFAPLLSVEGQRLLSWLSDDNFPFDDTVSGGQEASFFSLNLDSLAEKLSKASLAERLFIEPDVLPPELLSEVQTNSEKDPDHALPTVSTDAAEATLDGESSISIPEQNRSTFQSPESRSSIPSTGSCNVSAPTSSNQPLDDFLGNGGTSEKVALEVHAESSVERSSRFEGTAAEAELDMLLDSFSETKFFDSSAVAKISSYTSSETQASSSNSVPVHRPGEGPDARSIRSMNITLDDSLDDLLKETSKQSTSISARVLTANEVIRSSKL